MFTFYIISTQNILYIFFIHSLRSQFLNLMNMYFNKNTCVFIASTCTCIYFFFFIKIIDIQWRKNCLLFYRNNLLHNLINSHFLKYMYMMLVPLWASIQYLMHQSSLIKGDTGLQVIIILWVQNTKFSRSSNFLFLISISFHFDLFLAQVNLYRNGRINKASIFTWIYSTNKW